MERFIYDGEHIALVFDGQGNQTHRYLHGTQIDRVLADENAAGQVNWALTDNQGTVEYVVDSNGNVLNRISYNSFGRVVNETNPDVDFRFGYTGRELDSETGLYYYRARYYDPTTGRFIGEDPIGFAGGDENLYRYVGNSPTNFIDPSGLEEGILSPITNPIRDFIVGGLVGGAAWVGSQILQPALNKAGEGLRWIDRNFLVPPGNPTNEDDLLKSLKTPPYPNLPDTEGMDIWKNPPYQSQDQSKDQSDAQKANPDRTEVDTGSCNPPPPEPECKTPSRSPFGGADLNISIEKQLQGQGQLKDLRNSPNFEGVNIKELLKKTPKDLLEMRKNGEITKEVLKKIQKAFEGRDLGKRGKNKKKC